MDGRTDTGVFLNVCGMRASSSRIITSVVDDRSCQAVFESIVSGNVRYGLLVVV